MGEQATLRIDTPLGAGAKRALEGNYPRPQPEHYSVSTGHRIVHGHNKPTGVKAWHLFLDPLDKTKAGALEVEFPDDSTVINLFVEEHNLQFPEPSYSCKVNFRIKWRKIRNVNRPGSINVASEMELLPEDAPVSELVKEFPRTSDGQPITLKKQHETDPAKCLHAMPAHVKREHDLDDNATGQAIRAIFGEPLPDAIRKRGAVLCWKMIEDYDEANKPGEVKARFAPPAEPPAPANGSENGQGAALPTPPAIPIAPPTPAIAGDVPSALPAPVKEQSVNYPESPIVVFPQSNGSVIYKGIRFSVTLRLGGRFADALPLMDDFVKAHENKLIEIDPACLINRPATVMLPPAPAPAQSTMPAPAPAPVAAAPASDGGTVRIVEVKKVQDEGKLQYHLFDAPGSDRPAFRLRIENDFNKLRPFINLDAMEIGTRYAINVIADWKPSTKVGQNGQPFRNVATIRAA